MCYKKVETFEKKTNKKQTKTNKQIKEKQINNQTRNTYLFGADFFGGALSSSEKKETLPYFTRHLFFLANSISGYSDKERMFLISWTYKCTLHHIFCVLPAIIVKPIVSTFVKLLTTYSKLVSIQYLL